MINYPVGLSESEISLYISAYQKCNERIKEIESNPPILKTFDEIIAEVVGEIVAMWGSIVSDENKLKEFLLREVQMPISPVVMISTPKIKDKKWFSKYRESSNTLEYWRRYFDYLNRKPSWTLDAVTDIDNSTDALMNALADPRLNIKQDVRGLAFGYVQSGKTAHYIGLLNKATDAGYKIIIVLAGIHNNLRSQTQIRLEEDFLGYNVDGSDFGMNNAIGVGVGRPVSHHFQVLTSRIDKGDFNKVKAGTSINPPFILVTKKNASVLNRLIKYLGDLPISVTNEDGTKKIPAAYPLLVIDDEADQASLNTKSCYNSNGSLKPDFEPTKINGCIRKVLELFECNSYVGYTATPFANIFIPPKDVATKTYGDDLFPRDFIVNIPRSDNYVGALEFFGLGECDDEVPSMPLFRKIGTGSRFLEDNKINSPIGELPDELKTAIKSFIITVATRNLRGQRNKPNSMLIHIIRLKEQQNAIKKIVKRYYDGEIFNFIKYGDPEIKQEFYQIWEDDYLTTTAEMRQDFNRYMQDVPDIHWEEVWNEIVRLVKSKEIDIYCINGDSKDALIYDNHKNEPYNVIVIGGDKLSRGLTLEGLSVSYFTRNSNTYDTLMQMGRWFGYRPGYLDLCRLYTTKSLHGNFANISRATEDLVSQVHNMSVVVGQTPMEFGLGVESNPDLMITSRNKLRTGKDMKRDFSCHLSQTRVLDIDAEQFNENFQAVENLLYAMGKPAYPKSKSRFLVDGKSIKKVGQHLYWFGVSGHDVAQFLLSYRTSNSATRANSKYMADYIEDQNRFGGVTNWTVCLINESHSGKDNFEIAEMTIGAGIDRKRFIEGDRTCDIKTLTSVGHEYLDYDIKTIERVNELKSQNKSSDEIRRLTRDRRNGLLILYPIGNVKPLTVEKESKGAKQPFGFAIVFPDRQGYGDIKSYHINDIAVEMKNNDFDA